MSSCEILSHGKIIIDGKVWPDAARMVFVRPFSAEVIDHTVVCPLLAQTFDVL